MADTTNKVALGSTAFLIGAIVPALIAMNIFPRTEQLSELKAQMYKDFVQRDDFEKWVQRLDKRLENIDNKVEKIAEDRR